MPTEATILHLLRQITRRPSTVDLPLALPSGQHMPTDALSTSTRSRIRTSFRTGPLRTERRFRTSTDPTYDREWQLRATCSLRRSIRSAGNGVDDGVSRRTTSTLSPMGAKRLKRPTTAYSSSRAAQPSPSRAASRLCGRPGPSSSLTLRSSQSRVGRTGGTQGLSRDRSRFHRPHRESLQSRARRRRRWDVIRSHDRRVTGCRCSRIRGEVSGAPGPRHRSPARRCLPRFGALAVLASDSRGSGVLSRCRDFAQRGAELSAGRVDRGAGGVRARTLLAP